MRRSRCETLSSTAATASFSSQLLQTVTLSINTRYIRSTSGLGSIHWSMTEEGVGSTVRTCCMHQQMLLMAAAAHQQRRRLRSQQRPQLPSKCGQPDSVICWRHERERAYSLSQRGLRALLMKSVSSVARVSRAVSRTPARSTRILRGGQAAADEPARALHIGCIYIV